VKEGDGVLDVRLSDGDAEVMLITRAGRAIRFPESDLSVLGRTARGVKGIGLEGDDTVVGMLLIRRDAWVLSVAEDGSGKRTEVGEFPLQKRGGLGTLAVPSGEGTALVSVLEVLEGDEVMVVMAGGEVHRLQVDQIASQGRRKKGRSLVKPSAGDRVVAVTQAYGGGEQKKESREEGGEEVPGQLDLLG
jgi:DNA gyrase subunit A